MISNNILQCNKDIYERKNFAANLDVDNFINNLYHAAYNIRIINFVLLSSCLYIDVNKTWEYFTVKLVLAITNYKTKSHNNYTHFSILIYKNNRRIISLNY